MNDPTETMRAMVLPRAGGQLEAMRLPVPRPGPDDVLLKVHACAICRTDLHILDGELDRPKLPLVPGHEIVGVVEAVGSGVQGLAEGQRVGVPWLGGSCGRCRYCRRGQENLCDQAVFTGYTRDGGYAEYAVADGRYCFPLPENFSDTEAAPLLCAGLIGQRSYRMAGNQARRLGLYGFGAAAHIVAQVAAYDGREVYAFTRPGDEAGQAFARSLGAVWAGGSDQSPPEKLDAALIFAPVGTLVPAALKACDKGGVVVCGGIHMSDIPAFPYRLLWEERRICSVANLTRKDGTAFFDIAGRIPVRTRVTPFPLEQANEALASLREGRLEGAAVLTLE